MNARESIDEVGVGQGHSNKFSCLEWFLLPIGTIGIGTVEKRRNPIGFEDNEDTKNHKKQVKKETLEKDFSLVKKQLQTTPRIIQKRQKSMQKSIDPCQFEDEIEDWPGCVFHFFVSFIGRTSL
jgi:hypothetical protein